MAERICDNCMSRVPSGAERCPKCGIQFENTNPGGALPNGWVLGGRYTVGRYLDIDGEGVTYSAIDSQNLQRVTIKEFMPVTLCASRDEAGAIKAKPGCEVLYKTTRMDYADLFASLMRMGQVEGLIQVLDVIEENNTAYAVMEKVDGPTLAEYLTKREGPVESARALALLRPVINGVDMLHTSNLIHRGICPENIVLESGGTAKLGGFATLALRQQGSELKPKLYPGYSAPEQYSASEFEGRYTDIYALGAVLYRLVTGVVPNVADERKMQDTLRPARALNREIPAYLSSGIARAMRVLPAERIQNIPDLKLALAGEGGREARGPMGLTRQQMIIGGAAIGAVVLVILVILLIALLTRNNTSDNSSSISSSSSASSSVAEAGTVENFVGMRYEDIINQYSDYSSKYTFLEPEYLEDDSVAEGRVISQTPTAGTTYDANTKPTIQLVVSKGPSSFPMPNLISPSLTEEKAIAALLEYNISRSQIKIETVQNKGEYEPGYVVKTSPEAGVVVTPSTSSNETLVTLYVAGEVLTEPMPDLTGKTQADAVSTLTGLGVIAGNIEIVPVSNTVGTQVNGTVAYTTPSTGDAIAVSGTNIQLHVYSNYVMPSIDTSLYSAGKRPTDGLTTFLDQHGIPYKYEEVDNTDASLNGTIQRIDYTVGVEVSSSTPVVIYVYKNYTPPPSSTTSSETSSTTSP